MGFLLSKKKSFDMGINFRSIEIKKKISKIKRKRSFRSLDDIQTNLEGYVSNKIAIKAYKFYLQHLSVMDTQTKIEIGCAILFEVYAKNKNIIKLFKDKSIEKSGLMFYDMFCWILKSVYNMKIDWKETLKFIGKTHTNMGITIKDYESLLQAFNVTMLYYFKKTYNVETKYAIEQVYLSCVMIITKHNNKSALLRSNEIHDLSFLINLDSCLHNRFGREYLFRYLAQNFCDEMVVFLNLLNKYNICDNDKGKYIILKEIYNKCIQSDSEFEVNISHETRYNLLIVMKKLDKMDPSNDIKLDEDILNSCKKEIFSLINKQYWFSFVSIMQRNV